jgi:hypothetical protein
MPPRNLFVLDYRTLNFAALYLLSFITEQCAFAGKAGAIEVVSKISQHFALPSP